MVAGIGKSAIIGQKISATFNSTGTPSIFMHAADAVHGDLGMVQAEDIVICISNSGDTPEIRVLVDSLRLMGNFLVGLTGNGKSHLAANASLWLDTGVEKEACPNNLAPTSSTTAQLAMGDALAVALLEGRNFGPEDFARYHPGGALGKRLYLRLSDLYPSNPRPAVRDNTPLADLILTISENRLGAAVVVDGMEKVLGIVTDGDLRRMLQHTSSLLGIQAKNIMASKPITLPPSTLAVDAIEVMRQKKITQIIVAENQKFLGMVHIHDLNREGIL